jgi:methionine-rich copper-binding protein CopC
MHIGFRLGQAGLSLSIAALAFASSTSLVSAHARYEGSTPGAGATIAELPAVLEVRFSEELGSVRIAVTGPDGSTATSGSATIDLTHREHASLPLRSAGPGQYAVTWSNVSGHDGDPNDGAFFFSLAGTPAVAAPLPIQPTSGATQATAASQGCVDDGRITPGITDVRVNTYCKRQAIRDTHRDTIDENVFNFLLAEGIGLDTALHEAMEAHEHGQASDSDHH